MDNLSQLKFEGFVPVAPFHEFMKVLKYINVKRESGLAFAFNAYQLEI
jgi:hypothetical protein